MPVTEGSKEYAHAEKFLKKLAAIWPPELRTNENLTLSRIAAKAKWLLHNAARAGIEVSDKLVAETVGTSPQAMQNALVDFDKKLERWRQVDLLLHASKTLPRMSDLKQQLGQQQRRIALEGGVSGKEKKVKIRRWVHRRLRYLAVEDGRLKSRGWRTEAWGRIYIHVATGRFSLAQACHAEDLPYDANTEKEFRNEGYIGLQRWRKKLFPVDHDWSVPEKTFKQAIANLAADEPFNEEKGAVRDAFFLCEHVTSSVELAETLTAVYPELSKSFPRHRISRHVVYRWLADPICVRLGIVTKSQADVARREKAQWLSPTFKRMRTKQKDNQGKILRVLAEKPLGFGTIVQESLLPKSTADKNLRDLKKLGLVNKEPGWHSEYFLTEAGKEMARRVKEPLEQEVTA